jgi:hypothetical protein
VEDDRVVGWLDDLEPRAGEQRELQRSRPYARA